jgi:hypothetical protein
LPKKVAEATGESLTEAIRVALLERQARLGLPSMEIRLKALTELMERDVWSKLPPGIRGTMPTKEEEEEILGLGPEGY